MPYGSESERLMKPVSMLNQEFCKGPVLFIVQNKIPRQGHLCFRVEDGTNTPPALLKGVRGVYSEDTSVWLKSDWFGPSEYTVSSTFYNTNGLIDHLSVANDVSSVTQWLCKTLVYNECSSYTSKPIPYLENRLRLKAILPNLFSDHFEPTDKYHQNKLHDLCKIRGDFENLTKDKSV